MPVDSLGVEARFTPPEVERQHFYHACYLYSTVPAPFISTFILPPAMRPVPTSLRKRATAAALGLARLSCPAAAPIRKRATATLFGHALLGPAWDLYLSPGTAPCCHRFRRIPRPPRRRPPREVLPPSRPRVNGVRRAICGLLLGGLAGQALQRQALKYQHQGLPVDPQCDAVRLEPIPAVVSKPREC